MTRGARRWMVWLAAAVAAAALATSLSTRSASDRSAPPLPTVFAAASLTDVLPAIHDAAGYQFAGSDQLATQLREGARADVFVAANTTIPGELFAERLVERPVVFARNRIVLVVPRTSTRVRHLDDLTDESLVVVLGDTGVPVGDYTRNVLRALGRTDVLRGVDSYEADARAIAAKVALGEADAGFVYATDARAFARDVRVVELPPTRANRVAYAAAVLRNAPHPRAARAYLARLTSDDASAALEDAGFVVA